MGSGLLDSVRGVRGPLVSFGPSNAVRAGVARGRDRQGGSAAATGAPNVPGARMLGRPPSEKPIFRGDRSGAHRPVARISESAQNQFGTLGVVPADCIGGFDEAHRSRGRDNDRHGAPCRKRASLRPERTRYRPRARQDAAIRARRDFGQSGPHQRSQAWRQGARPGCASSSSPSRTSPRHPIWMPPTSRFAEPRMAGCCKRKCKPSAR